MMKKSYRLLAALMALCLIVVCFAGCGSSATESDGETGTVKIATKPITEELILGEMLKELIETNTNLTVELTKGVGGGTSNIHPAMVEGEFDLYPEYTGTSWFTVLKKEENLEDDALYTELVAEYEEQYQMTWTGLYGFNNTYSLAVSKEVADKYNLKTFSDLAKVSDQLIFGANPDFLEREDGYPGFTAAYNMTFKDVSQMDVGLKYTALLNGEVDCIPVFTTDGQSSDENVVVLEDDQHYFKNYYCGTIVRMDCLEKYPSLQPVLELLNDQITDEEMAKMNYAVEVEGKEDVDVAHEFLVEKGLVD